MIFWFDQTKIRNSCVNRTFLHVILKKATTSAIFNTVSRRVLSRWSYFVIEQCNANLFDGHKSVHFDATIFNKPSIWLQIYRSFWIWMFPGRIGSTCLHIWQSMHNGRFQARKRSKPRKRPYLFIETSWDVLIPIKTSYTIILDLVKVSCHLRNVILLN